MAIFPRPVTPRSALADLKDFLTGERPHKWPLLGLSVALTGVILYGFYLDSRTPPKPREIIYVESWMADRKDSTVIAEQKKDLANYENALQKKQHEFQHVADMLGIDWREDEARSKAQREAVIAAVQKRLDQRLAEAKRREAAEAAHPGTTHAD